MKKKKIVSLIALGVMSVSCASIATAVAFATEKPTVEDLFSYNNVTASAEATDGKTGNKGLLLSATQNGASAKMLTTQTGVFEANLKSLGKDGQYPLSNYSIKITDNDSGESFKIGVLDKKDYSNVYVEVANGNRGGIYYTNEGYNIHPEGLSANCNVLQQKYTEFYRNTAVTEETAGFGNSVKVKFNPETMEVSLMRGVYEYAKPEWAKVWDLDEQINDGHDIGYSYSQFDDYSVELVFDSVFGEGELLVYEMGGVDFSTKEISSNPVNIHAELALNAVRYKEYKLPEVSCYDLFGAKEENLLVSVTNEGQALTVSQNNTVKASKTGKMEITYALASNSTVSKTYTVDVVGSASCELTNPCSVAEIMGVNSVIEVPQTQMKSNLYIRENDQPAKVTVYRNGAVYNELQNKESDFSFVAAEEGEYEIKYVSSSSELIAKSVAFQVSSEEVAVVAEKISSVYLVNSSLDVRPAKVYCDGGELATEVTLYFPSGKTVGAGTVTLDEVGVYTLAHAYEHDGAKRYEQSFRVEQTADSMFSKADSKTEISYGVMPGNHTYSGVRLSLVENQPVFYEQIIDLSDNTKDDLLLELIAQPSTIGNNDITMMYITFTDMENENNTMTVRLAYTVYTSHVTYVTGKAGDKQWYTGYNELYGTVESATYHVVYGLLSRHSFLQLPRSNYTFADSTLKLYYDYEENALYSNPDTPSYSPLVCDFDDPKFFGANLWGGFNSGKVKMSIYGTGITSKGDVYILNVDGTKFGKETYTDDVAPVISPDFVGNEVPIAQVGREYKIVNYQAKDAYSDVKRTSYKVYYDGKEVSVKDGAFVPENTGVYTIVYTAVDYFGNESRYSLNVTALREVTTPSITIEEAPVGSVAYGETVNLPSYKATGGAGGLESEISVTVNGKKVNVVANQFVAEEVGTYVVTYKVRDYLGNVDEKSYFIDCQYSVHPILDESKISLPPAFIGGQSYTFDSYEAVFYMSGESKHYVSPKIEITDANGTQVLEGLTYTPVVATADGESVEKITVSFIFEQLGAEPLKITREVPAVHFTKQYGDQAKYFVTENATATADAKGIMFTANEEVDSFKLTFARALSTRDLRLVFSTVNAEGETVLRNYDSVKVTLQDIRNAAQKVSVNYVRKGGSFIVSLNGNTVNSNPDRNGEVKFQYNEETHAITDANDILLGRLAQTDSGLPFDGFDSGEVYVSIEVCGVIGECSLYFKSLNNQGFNYMPTDRVDPVLWVNGSISGSYDIGAKIVIPTAGAYDVLSPITPVTVTVSAPDGSIVLKQADATKEYTLTMGQFGTYFVRYEVRDGAGRTKMLTMSAIVRDIAAPTLTFSKEISTAVKVGDKVALDKYSIQDNKGAGNVTVTVSVFNPDGTYAVITEKSFKFTEEGSYILTFLAVDEDNNVTVYDFNIVATK